MGVGVGVTMQACAKPVKQTQFLDISASKKSVFKL